MAKLSVRDVEVSSRRDHIGWNSYEIISPLVSLGCSLFADLNITDLLQGNTVIFWPEIVEGYRKSGFWHTKL